MPRVTGHRFPPPASLHGRKFPCTIPARWASGLHRLPKTSGAGLAPCSRQLQLQTCVCLLGYPGYPRALSSCLELHRKNSHGTTLQTLTMTPRLSRVAFLSLWRLWASLKGLRHPSTPQLRGPLLPATPGSRGSSSSPPCTQSTLADLMPFLSPPPRALLGLQGRLGASTCPGTPHR